MIVDGHAYAYRAFYAIRSLSSPEGKPTNAIYGFIKMLGKMRATVNPSHLVVVWDGGLSEQRRITLPAYKAQRPEMPEELSGQLDEILRYLDAAKIASYREDGVEADDYISFLAGAAVKSGMEVVIASADKDFMQLVAPSVGLLNPNDKSETIWYAEQVRNKTGVEPEQIVDWLSLLGDSVDNIPGVPGVGVKTAADLLSQFRSVDEIFSRLEDVKSERVRTSLRLAEADVRRNQSLVRLQPEVGAGFSAKELEIRNPDSMKMLELFSKWGFRRMADEVEKSKSEQQNLI